MYFTETVAVSTLNVTQITLYDSPAESQYHSLGVDSTTSSPDGPVVVVQLSDEDLNRVKQLTVLATHEDYTWIELTSSTINDTSENSLTPVDTPVMVNEGGFIADDTRPQLLGFRLDTAGSLESLAIVLTFSETVNVDTLYTAQFELRVYPNDTCTLERCSYNLTGDEISPDNSTEITINVTQVDLEEIRLVPPLGHSIYSTFLSITSLAVRDMAGFTIEAISEPALQVSDIGFDLLPPYLVSFNFDLDEGTIELTFSEILIFLPFILEESHLKIILMSHQRI